MNNSSSGKSFNIPLEEYLQSHLGTNPKRSVNVKRAEILELLLHGTQIAHIQWDDLESSLPLKEPVLWWWKDWVSDVERVDKLRARSERERQERFILEANVRNLAENIQADLMLDDVASRALAFTWIKNKQYAKMKFVGVDKLIEKIEEL